METNASGPPGRVLVVDDEADVIDLVRDYLGEFGYTVETARTGEEALTRLDGGGTFDVVLLDLGLPGLSGIEVCRSIRARGDDTPILVLSAWDQEQDKVVALDSGADDYLTKPFGMRELLARVRVMMRRAGS